MYAYQVADAYLVLSSIETDGKLLLTPMMHPVVISCLLGIKFIANIAHRSACRMTKPVINFTGTFPSDRVSLIRLAKQIATLSVLRKSLIRILLVTENSPPCRYISSLPVSLLQAAYAF